MTAIVLIATFLLSPTGAAKDRDWKEAKILDVKYERKAENMDQDPRNGPGISARFTFDTWTYVVVLDEMQYELQEQNTKPTFNKGDTLKFAIEKKNWYFVDPKGKEKKGDIVGRKQLKKP
jgi:hypothetical protein